MKKKWTGETSLILVNLSVLDLNCFPLKKNNNHIRYPPQELDPILRVVEPVGQVMQPSSCGVASQKMFPEGIAHNGLHFYHIQDYIL